MSPSNRSLAAVALAVSLAAGLTACSTGPEFQRPSPPATTSYTNAPLDQLAAAGSTVADGQVAPHDWWTLFSAPRLDQTMQLALEGNHDLAAAQHNLAQSAALAKAAGAGLYPEVDLDASIGREKLGAASLGAVRFPAFTYYAIGPSVSYTLDYTGGIRRGIEAQNAQVDYQRYQLGAAYLSLTGNVALAALKIAAARAEITSIQQLLDEDQKNLAFVQKAFSSGAVPKLDVLSAQSQLANDQTLMAPLQQQLSVARHQLSVLVGRAPADWTPPDFDLDELATPGHLPLALPSELVRRRPDILAAEAQLHEAFATVGVAQANLYPQITLSAAIGPQASTPRQLFEASSIAGSLIGNLVAPVFDHGARRDRKTAAEAALDAALDRYQQTVLASFGQVADALEALDHDATLAQAEQAAVDAAAANLDLTRRSYQAGNVGIIQVLDAQRSNEQAVLGQVRARAQRLQDDMQLLLASGGPLAESSARR